ncbi:hypothetical protein [Brevibacillus massiliensis]|uniref:hypothetical protein n=1 Tax=Brevibacillus massiliensis TaxID=1118054 RepID=UPI0002D33C39|nr:hypothetical protein [Brevibacillus massiliensis]
MCKIVLEVKSDLNDADTIISKIADALEQEITSSVRKAVITDGSAGKLDSYETKIVVDELIGVLKAQEITIEEAERVLDQAKAELKHARLIGDGQAISVRL